MSSHELTPPSCTPAHLPCATLASVHTYAALAHHISFDRSRSRARFEDVPGRIFPRARVTAPEQPPQVIVTSYWYF